MRCVAGGAAGLVLATEQGHEGGRVEYGHDGVVVVEELGDQRQCFVPGREGRRRAGRP